MSSLVLIPWGKTPWSEEGRLSSKTPLSLTEEGRAQVGAWAQALAGHHLEKIYGSGEQTSGEVAKIIAQKSKARIKTAADLCEVDLGLWEGLTQEQLSRRYPKAFKRWREEPASVRPPEGESIPDASERLTSVLNEIARNTNGGTDAVVLAPIAFAIARCTLESAELSELTALQHDAPLCYNLAAQIAQPAPVAGEAMDEEVAVDSDPAAG